MGFFSLIKILGVLPPNILAKLADDALRLRIFLQEKVRQKQAREDGTVISEILSCNGERLKRSILEKNEPWTIFDITSSQIPGMLTFAEKQYYLYIGKFYSGRGEIVEIGSWLGSSTFYIVDGLLSNPYFRGRKVNVYDDFTWRSSWMDKWMNDSNLQLPSNHESFETLFHYFTKDINPYINVSRRKLCEYDGNALVDDFEWSGLPIELCFIDCGRTLEVNEAWYKKLSPYFISDRTLIVMQDWQNYKRVPEIFWENTKIFTDSKGSALDLVHEVRNSGIATFLYRNTAKC